jgi:hypothetical protein
MMFRNLHAKGMCWNNRPIDPKVFLAEKAPTNPAVAKPKLSTERDNLLCSAQQW